MGADVARVDDQRDVERVADACPADRPGERPDSLRPKRILDAAHAGTHPDEGASAVEELAHQILVLRGLNDPRHGITVNVGVIRGGVRENVVADHAEAWIDVRVTHAADVPKVARVAGLGIVKLAQISGRPIYPIAMATSRRLELRNWDRTTVNLPFARGATVEMSSIMGSDGSSSLY